MKSIVAKVMSTIGMLAIGDAIAFVLGGPGHVRVWSFRHSPRWYRQMSKAALAAPHRGIGIAVVELSIGVALATFAKRVAPRQP